MPTKFGIYRARVPSGKWGRNVARYQNQGSRRSAASAIAAAARGYSQRRWNYMGTGYPKYLFK